MTTSTRRLALAVSVAAMAAHTGCGQTAPTTVRQDTQGGPLTIQGTGPVDTVVVLDGRAVHDPELAAAYRAAALRVAEPTIEHGGRLYVSAFGDAAAASALVLDTTVPTLAQKDELQRVEDEDIARAELANGLDAALGLSDAAPQVVERLSAAKEADLGRAMRAAVRIVRPVVRDGQRDARKGTDARAAIIAVLSSGLNETDGLRLERQLGRVSDARLARAAACAGRSRPGHRSPAARLRPRRRPGADRPADPRVAPRVPRDRCQELLDLEPALTLDPSTTTGEPCASHSTASPSGP